MTTCRLPAEFVDWNGIEFVVFDVDGTLYRQRPLRAYMLRDLLCRMLTGGGWAPLSVLRTYRTVRERLADKEVEDFDSLLIAETAARCSRDPGFVRAVVAEWIEQRPLPYLQRCRYAGVEQLFAGLKTQGKRIGIFSDYPAREKVAALGLAADHVVSAGDAGVGRLKPHPRGLELLMTQAAVSPANTVLIGDRPERDGMAARRAGAEALIRSSRPLGGWRTFAGYDSPIFAGLVTAIWDG